VATTVYPTANHCLEGTKVDVDTSASDGAYNWRCDGSNGGTNVNCSANKVTAVNGTCGTASGSNVTSAPTSNLCATGMPSSVSGNGPRSWTCNGSNGGTNASCSANKAQCTLTFSGNGVATVSSPVTKTCGEQVNLLNYIAKMNTGYTITNDYEAWNTQSNGKGTNYRDDDKITLNSDMILYVNHWDCASGYT
jgi:hypothetical protein